MSLADLSREGFSKEVLSFIECLTRREQETYEEFIERVKLNPTARKIKLADIEDNMAIQRISEPTEKDGGRLKIYHQAWHSLVSTISRQ